MSILTLFDSLERCLCHSTKNCWLCSPAGTAHVHTEEAVCWISSGWVAMFKVVFANVYWMYYIQMGKQSSRLHTDWKKHFTWRLVYFCGADRQVCKGSARGSCCRCPSDWSPPLAGSWGPLGTCCLSLPVKPTSRQGSSLRGSPQSLRWAWWLCCDRNKGLFGPISTH